MLRYRGGLFLPEPGISNLDAAAREPKADEAFLALLARYGKSETSAKKPSSNSYAPTIFSREKEAQGLRKEHLADAMRRLFAAERIHVEHYGRPSRPNARIKLGRKDG